ncbi:MAG TPA: branched-chain amino acid ABC transporter permease [Acidocella sp.]|jgi:branched-chain amino acid transport system permease protein|uniref:branched-chain amino acid ABC transporter permease n=1 Tax=Acidocella sp. TaxID=50710 RepID=UPI002D0B9174|nr:branched-chain amino acid ABC transporter permease [Acidocella sp.]HVE21284.1 branched-chain amino acid ABC transporter permease [Acidocella sp.]
MTIPGKLGPVLSALDAERGRGRVAETLATIVLLAVVAGAPWIVSKAALNDLGQAILFGLFAISFNIVFKYSGLLSFGHAAFFGLAAYGAALLLQAFPALPVPVLILIAASGAGLLGLLLGHVCVRRAGAYFSMTTLAIGAFFYTIAFKWHAVTGGTDGLGSFMPASLMLLPGWRLVNPSITQTYELSVAFLIPVALAAWFLLERTPFGNAIQLVRQNEQRAVFLGYDAHRVKLANYGLAAFIAGIAGALWAIANGFVSTDSIDLTLSTTVIIMTFIGGSQWFWGPLLGSTIYIFGSDRLSAVTQHWQLWMGLVFILLVLVFPRGVAGLPGMLFARLIGRRDV